MVGNGRKPQDLNNIPFRELLSVSLRDRVSGKGGRAAEIACLPQMQALFMCFKKHDFDQTKCSPEVSTFQKCYDGFLDLKYKKKLQKQSESLIPGVKTITSKQLNMFLKKFPQPK